MTKAIDKKPAMDMRNSVPANLAVYVDVLGMDGAIDLFLAMGGSQVYVPKGRSSETSLLAQAIGSANVNRLAAAGLEGYIKVPLARRWTAQMMRDHQGKADNEIARLVRADVATVRGWLGPRSQGEQLTLPI